MSFIEDLNGAFPPLNVDLDVSYLVELLHYFPMDKVNISAGSYDQYLYDLEKTVIDNYDAGNFQVSFFYSHLIFMSYVYYCVERIYALFPDRTKDVFYPMNAYRGLDENGKKRGKPDLEKYNSVYDFSTIPEKDIFKLFHVMGLSDDIIKGFGAYINRRDDFAHATGIGNISEEKLIEGVRTIKSNMDTLSELFQQNLESCYVDFIKNHLEADYEIIIDNFNDFVFENELSIVALNYLCHLGVANIQNSDEELRLNYQATRNIHCAFMEYCNENDGIEFPDSYTSLCNENYLFYKYKNNANDYIEK